MENITVATEPTGQMDLSGMIAAMQQHAKTCETASADATEESLTGEACLREKNDRDAKVWLIKSQVWQEAVEVVRSRLPSP